MDNDPKDGIKVMRSKPDGGVSEVRGVGGILAGLWRQCLHDLNIPPTRIDFLCNQFIARARKGLVDARVANYFNKGNLRRELEKQKMTMKVYIKALKILDVVNVKIAVELTHRSGHKSIHSTSVNINEIEVEGDDND